jgi:hypothetical protein
MLILALPLLHVTPVELRQIQQIAVRIVKVGEPSRLAFIQDAKEVDSSPFECLHGVFERTLQFQTDRWTALRRARFYSVPRGMQPDGQALSQLHAGPVISEPVGQLQSESLGVKTDRTVHVGDIQSYVAAAKHASSMP